MPLSLRDIDYFLEIARLGQLVQAAANLEVSAPGLSKAVHRLEGELGLPLFDRSGQGMTLTPFGHQFVERAHRIKAEHDEALRHAGDVRAGRAGLLRLGATFAVLDTVIAPALARLQPRRPGLHAVLTVGSSEDLLERTRRGILDAAVVPTYDALPPELALVVLGSDDLVAVAREGHPVLKHRKPKLEQLAGYAWILPRAPSAARTRLESAYSSAGLRAPRAAVEVDFNSSWALPLVQATDLISLVPLSALGAARADPVRVVESEELQMARTICLFSRQDSHWSPLMTEFAEAVKALQPKRASGARRPRAQG